MEALLSRYRNLTVLLIVVAAQLLYLGYQVKTNRDERLIRVWAVSSVTPMAGVVEAVRRNTIGFLEDYFILLDVREQNRKLKTLNDRLRLENVYYRNQLRTAEHAHDLTLFQEQTPSKTVAARVIGNSTVVTAKAVFIDRGSTSGIEKGMAVVTPEGIVGKVAAVYPLVSQVLLVTDPTFKVGVESQTAHVHGVLNCGNGKCSVEQVQNEEKVGTGEWFFTSGEDRIFPKGFPVGTVVSAQPGQGMKDIKLSLSGSPAGAEEVLVVLAGVHQAIPVEPVAEEESAKALPPPPSDNPDGDANPVKPQTEADKVLAKYDTLGKEEGHKYGGFGSNLPNFNLKPGAPAPKPAATDGAVPDAGATKTAESDDGPDGGTNPVDEQTGTNDKTASTEKTTSDRNVSTPAAAGDGEASGPAVSPPAVLGARSTAKSASAKAGAAKTDAAKTTAVKPATKPPAPKPEPVLPLGAPRHKPATGTGTNASTTPSRPPQ